MSILHPAQGGPQPYELAVDNFWLNVLRHYFPLLNNYSVERESYTYQRRRYMANVVVARLGNNRLQKVVIDEGKRFPSDTQPGWEQRYRWTQLKSQLRRSLTGARRSSRTQSTMYGIAAVGDRVRFYQLQQGSNRMAPFVADPQNPPLEAPILSIHGDRNMIDQLIRMIRTDFGH
ncbi:uncharacterized protein BO66DRAFT_336046 [Aspergillus aculeatinus CBS 121060]|uniref:Uncharacterized protein n=1 Tax=Aspergillus aculeatinus CBS 121060 TaxID=1448322 RepID=A0ACD1GTH3_9EURO|nr:hypothetical protein BO66DRAFT_336046 [Aspergillus aculeatinus CBS 121060]RAH64504.1 hypothetical protein BO66DRAFT_336046 [Aspergillus aculeatinus CBS 121060]